MNITDYLLKSFKVSERSLGRRRRKRLGFEVLRGQIKATLKAARVPKSFLVTFILSSNVIFVVPNHNMRY